MKAKKIAAAIMLSAAVMFACAAAPSRVCFSGAESYIFYCGTSSADCREVHTNADFSLAKAFLKDICGEAAAYSVENFNLESFLIEHGAKVIFAEELSDSVNYYCSASLPYSVTLCGREINLHICVKREGVIAASPIIFGGY